MANSPKTFRSFLACKCPKCQEGKVFKHNPIHPKFTKVNETCPSCGVKFETEPGFFWGAMYFSYALVVGICIIAGVILYSIYDTPPLFMSAGIVIGLVLLLLPFILRYSRMLMIYFIAPYRQFDPEAAKRFRSQKG